jgi:hypothetical protein
MAETIVQYTGDGSTTQYSVPFEFIERTHVKVYVDGDLQATPGVYSFVSDSTIEFNSAPFDGAMVEIRRVTPSDSRLVVFTNAAVLPEDDLNLSAKQLFFLLQENRDLLESIITGTFSGLSDTLIESIAQTILSNAAALEIQSRITDIDAAGQLLLDEMMARRVIGEVSDTYDAFILDNDTIVVDDEAGETLAQRWTAITATAAANAAAIVTEQTVRASADSVLASDITALGVTIDGHTASITTLSTVTGELEDGVADLEARYGVALNVDGYITGFVQNNDGDTGSFDILADTFRVVQPSQGLMSPVTLFAVSAGVVAAQNMVLNGSLIVAGSITGAKIAASTITASNIAASTITADKLSVSQLDAVTTNTGTLTVDEVIKWGSASAYMTGTGGWMGMDSGTPKWRVGNPAGDYIAFDGTDMIINADVTLPGALVSNDDAGAEIARNDADASTSGGISTWQTIHQFRVYGSGTIAVRVNAYCPASGSGSGGTVIPGYARILKNGTTEVGAYQMLGYTAGSEVAWTGITVDDASDTFQVQLASGQSYVQVASDPPVEFEEPALMNWTSARANWALGEFF